MKKRRVLSKKKILKFICFFLIVSLLLSLGVYYGINTLAKDKKVLKNSESKKTININEIKTHYSDFVKSLDGASLCKKNNNKYNECVNIHGSVELKLDSSYEINDEYFKLLDSDYYISYKMVDKIGGMSSLSGEYKYYKNYVLFNQNILIRDGAKLYVDNDNYYEVPSMEAPIIINDGERYGIEFNNGLVYVGKDDVLEVKDANNSNEEVATEVAVLNYHYTISSTNENGELNECSAEICITDTMFDKHIGYLKENNYYAASIRDLELFMDDKIRLPRNSVVITIDDGWYVPRSINILEKYQMLGTLFLIGSLSSPDAYRSSYLEIHSHTWDMHTIGQCPSSIGRGGILCLDENVILEDLKKSRDSLNQTTYFCYPFYDYNARAIELLKKAGFTMAFAGGDKKARPHQDKFKIPRYVIVNYTTMNEFISYVSHS